MRWRGLEDALRTRMSPILPTFVHIDNAVLASRPPLWVLYLHSLSLRLSPLRNYQHTSLSHYLSKWLK